MSEQNKKRLEPLIHFCIFGAMLSLMLANLPEANAGQCGRVITADVVALDQIIWYNRLGAVNPQATIYALREDVVDKTTGLPEGTVISTGKKGSSTVTLRPGNVKLRDDKRPRPLVLRMNEGDCLSINFTNLMDPMIPDPPVPAPGEPGAGEIIPEADVPATRNVGMHANGVQLTDAITSDGSFVGRNSGGPSGLNGLVKPGDSITYNWYADKEGTGLIFSMAAVTGGEGGGGQLGNALFGAINIEPRGAEWYRSQVTNADLKLATKGYTSEGHPIIDYQARYPDGHIFAGKPILAMLAGNKLRHADVNAVITGPNASRFPDGSFTKVPASPDREQPFREFTVIFHDEQVMIQSFANIFNNPMLKFTLHGVRDGFAINYGSGAIGPEMIANRLGVGPMWDCPECKAEEFFLTSWAVGDPGMVVDVPAYSNLDANGNPAPGPKATKAFYPDDPSGVHHSYLNDHVKFRNLHAGPKEHHIYHLHGQQWLFSQNDDASNYLDAQHVGPGSGFTYEIAYGGSGNRNKTPGDAIFHCHFYPHFAQGMWELWRIHDVFEEGTLLDAYGRPAPGARALPDGEIASGTPIPALVPLPTLAMAPLPGKVTIQPACLNPMQPDWCSGQPAFDPVDLAAGKNFGYPFFIPGQAGHRPPTPAFDMDPGHGGWDGGLPRHIMLGNGIPADPNATHAELTPLSLDKVLLKVPAKQLPEEGNAVEKNAMAFHATQFHETFKPDGSPSKFETNGLPPVAGAPFADPCRKDDGSPATDIFKIYKGVHFQFDMIINKVGWHFPQSRIETFWQDAVPTIEGIRPPEPFVMRANTYSCVEFRHANLVPNIYEQDDFQVKMPTDIIGQHIHLVKFDLPASDGSANGYNYEDGTMSPDEVRERIHAINAAGGLQSSDGMMKYLEPLPHPFFGSTFNGRDITGARTTIQRWYVDPLVDNKGKERSLGNVFTHDHFGPSQHQQNGLYATFLAEPADSKWRNPETGEYFGTRDDGGPTSWRADIINGAESYREFFFEFQDFNLMYEAGGGGTAQAPRPDPRFAINPTGKQEVGLPFLVAKPNVCPNGTLPPCPTAISVNDDGTFSVNYRSEPVALRVRDPQTNTQATGTAGDLSFAFSSKVKRVDPRLNMQPTNYVPGKPAGQPLVQDMQPLDPFTPLMRVYENDRVKVRVQVGATEESHNVTIHGVKWLQEPFSPNTGYRNNQTMGISEQFILDTPVIANKGQIGTFADYLYSVSSSNNGHWNGTWGLMRTYFNERRDLLPLPNNPIGPGLSINNLQDFNGVCPKNAPVRSLDITAVTAGNALPVDPVLGISTLVYNPRTTFVPAFTGMNEDTGQPVNAPAFKGPLHDPTAIMFVRTTDLDPLTGKLKAGVPVEPLVLRAKAGECLDVTLRNKLPENLPDVPGFNTLPMIVEFFNANQVKPSPNVGLHPQLVHYDVTRSDGLNVGFNPPQTVGPSGTGKYSWYAGDVRLANGKLVATPFEAGGTNLRSSDPIKHSNKGALGALIIEPYGATWVEDPTSRAQATVTTNDGKNFRDFATIFQTDVNFLDANNRAIPWEFGVEDAEDSGQYAINYKAEPVWFRLGINPQTPLPETRKFDYTRAFSNSITGGMDPVTPIFTAKAGQQLRMRVLEPAGQHRSGVFTMHGHAWQREPYIENSLKIGTNPLSFWQGSQEGVGPSGHWDVVPEYGAGGMFGVMGDYIYRNMTLGTTKGQWGILRVSP